MNVMLTTVPESFPQNYIVARLTPEFLLIGGVLLLIAIFSAHLIGKHCANRWNGDDEVVPFTCMIIMGLVTFASLLVYGCTMTTVQAIILCGVYMFGSYSDIKSRELDDSAHVVVLTAALIGCELYEVLFMSAAGIAIGGVMLLVAVISKGGGVGGADIKLSAASAFLLGFQRGALGLCAGLIIGVIWNMIQNKKKGAKEGFPLVPYIAIGFMAAFFIK